MADTLPHAEPTPCPTCSGQVRETVGMVCQTCGTDYAADPNAEPTPVDDTDHLRALAVVDPDGLRAEVERLRVSRDSWIRIAQERDDVSRKVLAQRDDAVREAAALRERVEHLTEQVQTRRRYQRLHAIKHHGARPLTDAERAQYPKGYDPLAHFPDAANPALAALRAGVEAVLTKWSNDDGDIEFESGFDGMRLARDLRAVLAHPTETDTRPAVAAHHKFCERIAFHEPGETPCTWRERACVDIWPGAESGEYNPACCRFPKSCSVDDVRLPAEPTETDGDSRG